jgi:RimJ/RimL family protein N-acetyltransferase
VLRFGFAALDLHTVDYSHPIADTAAARVAEKLGWQRLDVAGPRQTWRATP